MLKKKRYLLVCIIVIALFMVLAGSGFGANTVNLRVQYWRSAEKPASDVLQEAKVEFEKLNPNIKIIFESTSYNERLTKLTTQFMGGMAPDVVGVASVDVLNLVNLNFLRPIDSFIQESGGKKYKDLFFSTGFNLYTVNGQVYGVPESLGTEGIFYNTEMFKKAGLDPNNPPQDWDTFLEYAKQLTKDTNGDGRIDQWGFALYGSPGASTWGRFWQWFWTFGSGVLTPDCKKTLLDQPASQEAFKFYVELLTKYGVVPPNAVEIDYNAAQTMFAQGTVAMVQNGPWHVGDMAYRNPKMKAGVDYLVTPLPVKKGVKRVAKIDGAGMCITTQSKNPEAAWKWISFWTSKEIQIKYTQRCSFLPARADVAKMPWYQNNSIMKIFLNDIVPIGRPMPISPHLSRVGDVLIRSLQSALLKKQSPEQACKAAAKNINSIISQ